MSKRKPLNAFSMDAFLSGKKTDTEPVPVEHRSDTGPVPDKIKTKPTIIRLAPQDRISLEREAVRQGTSMAAIIRGLVREHLRGLR